MSMSMYVYGGVLILIAVLLLVVPMLKYRRESWVTPLVSLLIVLFPLAVVGLYAQVSSFNWNVPTVASTPKGSAPVDALISELAVRMGEQPTVEGWVLLGNSYTSLGRYTDAVDAWYEAWRMGEGKDPEISLGYAEALIMADQRTLRTTAVDLLEDALKAMPNDPRALWYAGLSAAARGNNELAIDRLTKVLQLNLPDDLRAVVQQQLASLGQAAPTESATAVTTIKVSIDISEELRGRAAADDLLFLIARDQDNPMPPVAVKRVRVGDFPLTLSISDTDVMIPGKKLIDVNKLVLVARISKSNQAFQAPGDLYGQVLPEFTADDGLQAIILIDQVVAED
jgi:cytochrome c-type biogenesis protein CcmH